MSKKKSVILFASGGGSNALAIINYFKDNKNIDFPLIVSNNPKAGVLEIAKKEGIPSVVINKEELQSKELLKQIQSIAPDLIVLAGFLLKIPESWTELWVNQIVNIHPALLPEFGGKGMYGKYVHQAVKEARKKETGMTIHYVNANYDEGNIIMQARCLIEDEDNPEQIAAKVLRLEHYFYPRTIAFLLAMD